MVAHNADITVQDRHHITLHRADSVTTAHRMRFILDDLRALPKNIRALLMTTFVSRAGANVMPFLVLFLTQVHEYSPQRAESLFALYGLGAVLASLCGGVLTDRFGSRTIMLLSYCGAAMAAALLIAVHGIVAVAITIFLTGFAIDLIRPAGTTLISRMLSGKAMVTAFSLQHTMLNAGVILAPMIGTWLLLHFGFSRMFLWQIVTELICVYIAWRFIVEVPSAVRAIAASTAVSSTSAASSSSSSCESSDDTLENTQTAKPLAARIPWRTYGFSLWLTFIFLLQMILSYSLLPLFVRDTLHGPMWWFASTTSYNATGILLCAYLITRIVARWHPFLVSGIGVAIVCVGSACFTFAHDFTGLLGAETIFTLGEAITAAQLYNVIALLAPPSLRGRMFGLSHAVAGAAGMVTPLLVGFALQHFSPRDIWLGSLPLAVSTWCAGYIGYRLTPWMTPRADGNAASCVAEEVG